jgi:acyl dehydratase
VLLPGLLGWNLFGAEAYPGGGRAEGKPHRLTQSSFLTSIRLTAPHGRLTLRGVPTDVLPDYRITARNTSKQSENLIHDDSTARRYGFAGALVPGVTVYGYLTQPLVATFGPAWLDRGTANVRFLKPILEGDAVVVSGSVVDHNANGTTLSLAARVAGGEECAVMSATIPAGLPAPVNLAAYQEAALPDPRPPVSREVLLAIKDLGTPVTPYDEGRAREFLAKVDDPLALYQGKDGRVQPAFYLDQANRALSGNVRLGPWIHASSIIRHLGRAKVGDTLRTRGRIRSLFEKKGREFVELDLVIVSGEKPRAIAHILHTAIYHLPPLPR